MIAWVATAFAGTWGDVKEHRSDDRFVVPAPDERAAWSALVADLVRAAPLGVLPADLPARAAALGFERLESPAGTFVLADRAADLRGAGLFAVRLGRLPSEIVLQAPHPFYDRGTGEIAAALFDAGGARALCVATANRNAAPGADPAHAPEGWFQAATDGMARALEDPLFVQLHGFAANTTDACAVLSEGATHRDPAALATAAGVLAAALGCAEVRTGDQVPELAARRNVQGLLLVDRAAFLHLELSPAIRETLLADPEGRARLSAAFAELARSGPP